MNDDGLDLFDDDEWDDGDLPGDEPAAAPRRGMSADDTEPARPRHADVGEDEEDASVDELMSSGGSHKADDERKRRHGPRIFLAAILALVLLVVGILAFYLRSLHVGMNNVDRAPMGVEGTRPPAADSGAQTFVLIGSDSRGWDRGRSDTLIVAYLPADRKKLYLTSFLRDMWVTIPANDVVKKDSKAKINAAYSWGGVPLTTKVLEQLTNVRMDHAAVTDFNGFKTLTDDLGGVQLYNPQEFSSLGHQFPVGNLTLDGEGALAYVHERKSLKNGDIDRAANERAVLTALIDKAFAADTLTNPAKFAKVVKDAGSTMTVDDALTNAEVRKLATSLKFDSGADIVPVQAPISGFGKSSDGQAYDVVDTKGLQELSEAMRTDTMDQYVAKHHK